MTDRQLKYLSQNEIDKKKWDDCIRTAPNGLIYAYSFYLDAMAKHWDALVLGDYETVMPLTWNKKYGFHYLYQPAFTASLGVFGKNVNEESVKQFLDAVPAKFRLIEIALNAGNNFPAVFNNYWPRNNFILELGKPCEELQNAYRDNHKRNIAKATQLGCRVSKQVSVEEVIKLNEEQLKHTNGTRPEDYPHFKKLYYYLKGQGKADVYAIVDANKKVLASAVFFFSHNRAYYIMVGNHPDGKTIGASHALIDAFIKDHACQNLILDFEGSDILNLAFFYSGFGAKDEIYPWLKINRLPFYLKWMKR
jgi:hypothetical protein